ncbi:hypothetical protein AB0M50_46375 [Nonomuraea fuscirosea]|uniref:hypothetical protein n=1 Tax=Nonomuraea fuscirosea TaxID=1291556 RepID=UPI00343C70D0
MVANFAEVFLAKEGHDGPVGVNYLEKIQLATPAAVYGAMLAGADYVLIGAGIPMEIPRLLDDVSEHRPARISVVVAGGDGHTVGIDPAGLLGHRLTPPARPRLLAIVWHGRPSPVPGPASCLTVQRSGHAAPTGKRPIRDFRPCSY